MAKKNGQEQAQGEQATEQTAPAAQADNRVLTFRRNHPGNRCSYGIDGNPGIVVVDRGLVAGTVPTTSNEDLGGMPATITVDVALVPVKADGKAAKLEQAAAKAAERAAKAQGRIDAAKKRAEEKAAAAQAAAQKAQERVAAAQRKAAEAKDAPAAE